MSGLRGPVAALGLGAWVSLVMVGTGCLDFERGRPYRCATNQDCAGEWQCLQDGFCHDPSVGASVKCSASSGCTGGWFCGQEGVCLNPALPGAFPCDTDAQCAGSWRCSTEHRCLDFTVEPQPLPLGTALPTVSLRSPMTSAGDVLFASPIEQDDGSTKRRCQAAVLRGSTLELVSLTRDLAGGAVGVLRRTEPVGVAPAEVRAMSDGIVVRSATGQLTLFSEWVDGLNVTPPFFAAPTDRIVPLTWRVPGGHEQAFVALSPDRAAFISMDGGVEDLGPGVLDFAVGPSGGPDAGFLLLRASARPDLGATLELLDSPGKASVPVFQVPAPAALSPPGRVVELRVDRGGVALRFEDEGIIARDSVRRLCTGDCGSQTVSAPLSCNGTSVADFSVKSSPDPSAAISCREGAQQVISTLDTTGREDVLAVHHAGLLSGVSGGHVRQLPEGQLACSDDLVQEAFDLLPGQPEQLAVAAGAVLALEGLVAYAERPTGLEPFYAASSQERAVAAVVEGANAVVLAHGVVLEFLPDGGDRSAYFVPVEAPLSTGHAAQLEGSDGGVFVLTSGDTLFAASAPQSEEEFSLLEPRLRLVPGFPVEHWIFRAGEAQLLEGWALSNNRLFRVTATSADRWKSSEVTVTGKDPLGLWFSGGAALLGTVTGEVVALPSRVVMSPPLPEDATSITGNAGAVFATTVSGTVWTLGPGPAWRVVPTRSLEGPRLWASGGRVFVTDDRGVVLELR